MNHRRLFNPKSRCAICFSVLLLAVLVLVPARQLDAISIRHDRPVADYNNLASLFPATGYFGSVGSGQFCTGTLVAPNKVLTAAHCVDFNANGIPDNSVGTLAFGLGANVPGTLTANVSAVAINPNWVSSNGNPMYDMAVLTLSSPITSVAPARIYDADPSGLRGFLVGYGGQGTGNDYPDNLPGANDKLGAENMIDFVGNRIEVDFDSPAGNTSTYGSATPLNLEGITAPGDSGSPLYAEFGPGRHLIVGTLFGGSNPFGQNNEYGDLSIFAAVSNVDNAAFLSSQGIHPVPEPASGLLVSAVTFLVVLRRRGR